MNLHANLNFRIEKSRYKSIRKEISYGIDLKVGESVEVHINEKNEKKDV